MVLHPDLSHVIYVRGTWEVCGWVGIIARVLWVCLHASLVGQLPGRVAVHDLGRAPRNYGPGEISPGLKEASLPVGW